MQKFNIPSKHVKGFRAVPSGIVQTNVGLCDFIKVLEWYAKEVQRT
jgi:hypothetical protein